MGSRSLTATGCRCPMDPPPLLSQSLTPRSQARTREMVASQSVQRCAMALVGSPTRWPPAPQPSTCMPLIALAYFFLWFLPPFTSLRGLWYTSFYCLFQALATFFQVPYTALTMILTPSPRERDSATAYRMTMEMAGTLMGATVHGLIVSSAHGSQRCEDTVHPRSPAVSPDVARLYCIAAAVVALTYPVCGSLLCLGVKEQPDTSAPASGQGLNFFTGLAITSQHPPYLSLVVSFLFISAAVQVEQSYLVLFCTHASKLQDHVQNLVLIILVSAVLSTPLWEWVLQRFGKKTSAFGICVMVPFSILLAAVPTCMILIGLCILLVGPTPKMPRQDTSSQLSLRRRTSYSLA